MKRIWGIIYVIREDETGDIVKAYINKTTAEGFIRRYNKNREINPYYIKEVELY
jgi:hypothetical protein